MAVADSRRASWGRAGVWLALVPALFPVAGVRTCEGQQADRPPTGAHRRWVGMRYPPLPEGVRVVGGSTIGTADTARFAFEEVTAGAARLLWLAEEVGRVGRRPVRLVRDVLELPALETGRWLSLGLCGSPRTQAARPPGPEDVSLDPRIAAIVRVDTAAVWTEIERAWRADLDAGRFAPIDTAGIACLNEFDSGG